MIYAASLNLPLGVGAAAFPVHAMSRADGFGQRGGSAVPETLRRKAALPGVAFSGQGAS
ncbi:hypothetical protein [Paracoccus sp. pheM1]|uniref:hypothetical protein n=1 Tax=Paracoccus sp. pheM1 TaxID=2831675 RepID=UPI001BDB7DA7|nr:hypothetical protein [Paracoccus sp. pheM1]MBT0781203.1 hypothetical protein [Paracoccus sp. pheM1]